METHTVPKTNWIVGANIAFGIITFLFGLALFLALITSTGSNGAPSFLAENHNVQFVIAGIGVFLGAATLIFDLIASRTPQEKGHQGVAFLGVILGALGMLGVGCVLLFGEFIVPQWSYIYSTRFLGWWLLALPIIVLIFTLVGVRGGVEFWKVLLWFGITIVIALGSQYAFLHKKFDSDVWKKHAPMTYDSSAFPTLRQRMVNDLVGNVLPNTAGNEIKLLLGEPNDTWIWNNTVRLLYPIGNNANPDSEVESLFIYYDMEGHYQDYYINDNCGG